MLLPHFSVWGVPGIRPSQGGNTRASVDGKPMKPSKEAQRSRDRPLRQPTVQAGALFSFAEFLLGRVLFHFGGNSA